MEDPPYVNATNTNPLLTPQPVSKSSPVNIRVKKLQPNTYYG